MKTAGGGYRGLTGLFFPLYSGFIKNTEKLSYGKERMYKLTVTAYDCGKNRASEDVLVKISVKPTCKPSWQGNGGLLCPPQRSDRR